MLEHQEYLEAVRELTDWLMSAGEELQHWSDTSGDSASIKKRLSEVRVSNRRTDHMKMRLVTGSIIKLWEGYQVDKETVPALSFFLSSFPSFLSSF